jgi:hypothetical protein
MSRFAEEPLQKITTQIYASDYEWLRFQYPEGYQEVLRKIVRKHRRTIEAIEED